MCKENQRCKWIRSYLSLNRPRKIFERVFMLGRKDVSEVMQLNVSGCQNVIDYRISSQLKRVLASSCYTMSTKIVG